MANGQNPFGFFTGALGQGGAAQPTNAGSELTSQPTGIPGLRDVPILGPAFGDPGGDITFRPSPLTEDELFRQAFAEQQALVPQQQAALGQIQQAALGQAPSAAEAQLAQGLGAAQRQSLALASSARGGAANQLTAQRFAQQQGSQLASAANRQAAILRAQEQERARAMLLQGLGGFRQQQLSLVQLAADEQARVDAVLAGLATAEAQAATAERGQDLGFIGTGLGILGGL